MEQVVLRPGGSALRHILLAPGQQVSLSSLLMAPQCERLLALRCANLDSFCHQLIVFGDVRIKPIWNSSSHQLWQSSCTHKDSCE